MCKMNLTHANVGPLKVNVDRICVILSLCEYNEGNSISETN
jgi:hypothetical protein